MRESLLPEYNWLSLFRGILTQVTSVYLRNQSNKLLNKTPVTCENTHASGTNILTQNNLTSSSTEPRQREEGLNCQTYFQPTKFMQIIPIVWPKKTAILA